MRASRHKSSGQVHPDKKTSGRMCHSGGAHVPPAASASHAEASYEQAGEFACRKRLDIPML